MQAEILQALETVRAERIPEEYKKSGASPEKSKNCLHIYRNGRQGGRERAVKGVTECTGKCPCLTSRAFVG